MCSASLNYRLSDRWTLTTGLRYQEDRIERSGNSVLAPRPLDYQKTFSAFLPKVSLAFAATPDWTVGGLVSRGYNPGGVSLNLTTRNWAYFKEETIWNYELFTRASLLDGRLLLNGNLFFMDFKDAQYNIPVVVSPGVAQSYTINAEKAHAYGMELDLDYRLRDDLRLKASAGVLRTRIDEMSGNTGYEHNEFARSPGYTLSFGPSLGRHRAPQPERPGALPGRLLLGHRQHQGLLDQGLHPHRRPRQLPLQRPGAGSMAT